MSKGIEYIVEKNLKANGIEDKQIAKALVDILTELSRSDDFIKEITDQQKFNDNRQRSFRG